MKIFIDGGARLLGVLVLLAMFAATSANAEVAQTPLFLTKSAEPIVMLNMSNDHQLFFKAYDDYTDLDGDGSIDTGYEHDFVYFGYFDPYKCYSYASGRYTPASASATKYCSNAWSGNFLNWVSMTRMDAVRKILYGGKRSTDTDSTTVLERAFLPTDAHSFAKFYDGSDLNQLTPFTSATGATFCNTTYHDDDLSQDVTAPPLLRVARGNHSLWAANERWQCNWADNSENSASNGNASAQSGIAASSSNPSYATAALGDKEYIVRVEVCVDALIGTEDCKRYSDGNYKPVGLLQGYGDEGRILFGLITGSYGKNKSGGVLRKNAADMADEINVDTDGTFRNADGIIATLDSLRVYGYRYDNGTYFGTTDSDSCSWGLDSFSDGSCSNWGNPQAEIFLESLRYLAGESATAAFASDDDSYIDGLNSVTWQDPVPDAKWCSALNIIQFNASTVSFDGDGLAGFGDLTTESLSALTNTVGAGEGIHGNEYFVGENGSDNNQLCTAKTVSGLTDVRGTCPDAPRLSGSYQMAGLAHFAKTNSIRSDRQGDQTVTTYGVALAPALPRVEIPVPGLTDRVVGLLPACRNSSIGGNCAIVDFKIVEQDIAGGTGTFYVNWEDSEQGGDFDQDMWGLVAYSIGSGTITITTDVIAQSTPNAMGFGYIISGTNSDGFHVHSGINNFDYDDSAGVLDCNDCTTGNSATSVTYTLGTSSASLLEPPLYYAAKWGGFVDSDFDGTPNLGSEWDADNNGLPDTYFYAIDPNKLKTSLDAAFEGVVKTSSSAASVATNSTRLDVDTVIYQARFNSEDWRGQLLAFEVEADGSVGAPVWDAAQEIPSPAFRDIFTMNTASDSGVSFEWENLSTSQQANLNTLSNGTVDTLGDERLAWLRGDTSAELRNGGSFRDRRVTVLGDIVNSDPAYVGTPDFRYHLLPGTEAASYVTFRDSGSYQSRRKMLYVGANDGMLHAIDANTGQERFAYVPSFVYDRLADLAQPDYEHAYYVDGSAKTGDAYVNSQWRTVLLGTLGGGGAGVFALDITYPDSFSASKVMWEYTDADLGKMSVPATVVRLNNGDWAALFGNGFESTSGRAYLYLVDLEDGTLIRKIPAGNETSNGLSTPVPVDVDGDRITDFVYAGDLRGNVWKFDLEGNNKTQWESAYKQGANDKPLFTAVDDDGNRQPITVRPAVGVHPDGGYMLYFGTGKFFATGDNQVIGTLPAQTFYGIRDNGSEIAGRGELQAQTIEAEVSLGASDVRVVSENTVDYSTDNGWYLDLVSPVFGQEGERAVSNPVLRDDRIIFTTLIPSAEACDFGGSGWLMELDAISGSRLPYTVLDINDDGLFDENDFVDVDGTSLPASGLRSDVGIIKSPGIISAGNREFKYASGSTGEIAVITERSSLDTGRKSWREIK